jgi:hypothetical protein
MEIAGDASKELSSLGVPGLSGNLINTAQGFLSGRNRAELIQMFIDKGHVECWSKVKVRDAQFFLENAERLFGKVQGFDLNLFQDVFRKDQSGKFLLSAELIEDVWLNMDAMIKISINYIHNMRGPGQVMQNGSSANCYYKVFYPEVDLQNHATTWEMNLKFTP